MVICVDFDGVIHNPDNRQEDYRMGQPVEDARESMTTLKNEGHEIIIHSARIQDYDQIPHIEAWLRYFRIPFDSISLPKPKADLYIDDKGLHFVNWADTLGEIGISEFTNNTEWKGN